RPVERSGRRRLIHPPARRVAPHCRRPPGGL
ncbi:MAG: hypothetical protein AVDCRST_MAG13-3601, partial [uncultured Solirubrobacteraceae bacterium]